MNEQDTLTTLLTKKEKLVALLAPSFPISFPYPGIITMLKQLGFSYVMEVAEGAIQTNRQLTTLFEKNPNGRFITSPCPTIVHMIRNTYPQYAKYLTHDVDSPMIATAKIAKERYPGYTPVFIGPCMMKKQEASEDPNNLNILVLTYTELQSVFSHFHISPPQTSDDSFDNPHPGKTRMYPLDGGLAFSSGITNQLTPEAVRIVSGAVNNIQALEEFEKDRSIKLLDILNCPGGCIFGPGIKSTLTFEERKKRILEFTARME